MTCQLLLFLSEKYDRNLFKTLTPGHTLRLSTQIAKSDCKSSGAFFMTEAGVAEELPTEPIGYLKVVTLGESTLSAEELTSIAGNLANGAVIDLGEATFATTEFPMDFTRKTNLQEILRPFPGALHGTGMRKCRLHPCP